MPLTKTVSLKTPDVAATRPHWPTPPSAPTPMLARASRGQRSLPTRLAGAIFSHFCEQRGAEPLPASDATVAGYLAELADAGLKAATIARRLVVISQAHKAADLPSPTTSSLVRRTHAGIRRSIGTAQTAKAPALVDDLKRMLDAAAGHACRAQGPRPAAARLRRRLSPLRAGGARRRRSRVFSERAGGHPEKIQDRPGGPLTAHRHPVRFLGEDLPGALGAGLARDGAHRRRGRVPLAGSVSARAVAAALGQGRGADCQTQGGRGRTGPVALCRAFAARWPGHQSPRPAAPPSGRS